MDWLPNRPDEWTAWGTWFYTLLTGLIAFFARRAWISSRHQVHEMEALRRTSLRPILVPTSARVTTLDGRSFLALSIRNIGPGPAMRGEIEGWVAGGSGAQATPIGLDILAAARELPLGQPAWGIARIRVPLPPQGEDELSFEVPDGDFLRDLPIPNTWWNVFVRLRYWGMSGPEDSYTTPEDGSAHWLYAGAPPAAPVPAVFDLKL